MHQKQQQTNKNKEQTNNTVCSQFSIEIYKSHALHLYKHTWTWSFTNLVKIHKLCQLFLKFFPENIF